MDEIPCETRYTAEGPYPEVHAGPPNPRIGKTMLSNVGSGVSEMSAIGLYLYGQFTTPGKPEIAECFHRIAIVEMHHLAIFSELARQLGEEPRLWSPMQGRWRYWTPDYLRYPRRLDQKLRYAIEEEQETIRRYRQQASWIEDANVVENLRRIVEDEEVHITILKNLYESYCQDLDLGLHNRATK